jgi:23S rRNA (adenine2503-C2)-methyltransferase
MGDILLDHAKVGLELYRRNFHNRDIEKADDAVKINEFDKSGKTGKLDGMEKIDLKGMDRGEMESFAEKLGLDSFRGRQIFRWIYQQDVGHFDAMTDISKPIRIELSESCRISELAIEEQLVSSDGSVKFLFRLDDGLLVESVLIPEKNRVTLCVSSQAGCPGQCAFCATGQIGFRRNLDSGEIVDQFLQAQRFSKRRISNIVFMGMGEPMLNLQNVLKACRILNDDYGPSLSQKKITISTVGVLKGMREFISSPGKLGLAISLHSADEQIRRRLIPLAKRNKLADIMAEAGRYTKTSRRRVSFEYLLLGGVNDSIAEARKLVKLIEGIPCKINLIRYNPVEGLAFRPPDEADVIKFRDYLYPRVYAVMIRESRGQDINGACGQLAGQVPGELSANPFL